MSHKKVSLSALRWREDRVREEIYKAHFKQIVTSSNGASLHGLNGTTIERDEQTPDNQPAQRMSNRSKTRPIGRAILPSPVLSGAVGLWYWACLSRLESTVDEPPQGAQADE